MSAKQHILNSIAATAKQLGRTPTRGEFLSRSGISLRSVLRWFPKWSAAIRAAGLRPYSLNVRIADRALLEDWGKTVRGNRTILKYRDRLPRHIYRRQGKFNPHTLALRFGGWAAVPRAFREFATGKPEWADVLAHLPASNPRENQIAKPKLLNNDSAVANNSPAGSSFRSPHARRSFSEGGPLSSTTYGDPLDFPGFRHEPINEQGVVLLFGMLANQLGFIVESVQKGFPDCEAKRKIAPDRWQRVHIEFEYESRNFRDHGHPLTGCDLIVCWRHNWPECPKHLEILELSGVVKTLAGRED